MSTPTGLRYAETHEWVREEGETAIVGITAHAAEELGDIVILQLPVIGSHVKQGEPLGEIESLKAVSDLYAPVSGAIEAVNEAAVADPQQVNDNPFGDGWLVRIRIEDREELQKLLTADQYEQRISEA